MRMHADVRVVGASFRRRKEYESCMRTGGFVGSPNQLPANSAPLVGLVNRKV